MMMSLAHPSPFATERAPSSRLIARNS
jgi:hypothetical protein